jgi:hypothetical protein
MAEDKKPAAEKKAAPAKSTAKKGGTFGLILLMTAFGAATPLILPSLFLLVGMIPTLVILFTDTDRNQSSTVTVGAMNAAGVAPFIIELWQKGQTMDHAIQILLNPNTWLVMLGAAALGKVILIVVPQAIASVTLAQAESRLALLKSNLETLKRVWGPDVANSKPIESIVKGE